MDDELHKSYKFRLLATKLPDEYGFYIRQGLRIDTKGIDLLFKYFKEINIELFQMVKNF